MKDEFVQDLAVRTKRFALRIIRLYSAIPKTTEGRTIGKQILRSGILIGAHYREANRARSTAEFVSKMELALQELDETSYWMELLVDGKMMQAQMLADLRNEADELIAILVSCVRNAKRKMPPKPNRRR